MERNWKGRLQASVCEARLGAWELSTLEPNDVVVGDREAGYSYPLLFDNVPIGLCEAVVIGKGRIFGARVVDPDYRSRFDLSPGRQDELAELVPVTVALGEAIPWDLAAAPSLPRNSVINLGVRADGDENATLYAAGVEVARGQVAIVGERMAFVTRRVTARFPSRGEPRASGALRRAGERFERLMLYDFARPDRFSKRQIAALAEIHELFARNLDARVPAGAPLELSLVDQLAAYELPDFYSERGVAPVFAADFSGSRRVRPREEGQKRPIHYDPEGIAIPLDPESRQAIDRYFTREDEVSRHALVVAAAPDAPSRPRDGTNSEVLGACVSAAWRDRAEISVGPAREAASLPGWEMTVVVAFARAGSERTELVLVYPFTALEPYLRVLGE